MLKRWSVALLASALAGPCVFAASPEETASELQSVELGLEASTARVDELKQKIVDDLKVQSEISDKLIEVAKTVNDQQAAVAAADGKIKGLEARSVELASNLAEREDQLSALLAGLQHLQQNPPPALVIKPGDVLEAMRGAMMFGAVVPNIRDQALALRSELDELVAIREETRIEKEKQQKAIVDLQASQDELTALLEEKKALAVSEKTDLAAEKKKVVEFSAKAKSLKELLASLEKTRAEEEARKAAEAKAAAEAAAKAEAEKAAEAKALADAAAKAEAERLAALAKPPVPFSQTKGKLAYPVAGAILKHFGDDNGLGSSLDGMAFATHENVNVISPIYGRVEFAGPFRSYGQLLILNAGEGYLVLLAGMKQISAEIGQSIKAGEPVGQMGTGPSTLALLGDEKDRATPVVYVEFRKDDSPVDPTPWWSGNRKEAMR